MNTKLPMLLGFMLCNVINAQVGINTTSPHPSAMLEISSADKGILVPRVSLASTSTQMLDGSNMAATGLLIWNTNATTAGGAGTGF